ncbi:MAG: serine/threonine-protein kinase [Pyrinomonadaceae bacterium]
MDVPHIIAGRFRIECEIGRGGMGTVYRATHLGLERPVAVKIIKPEFAADAEMGDCFMREARTMARLRHPHAAMIFDAGSLPDNRHFIVMEYVEGATLAETLRRETRFTPERAVEIAASICDVLAEAHKLGIVHRDLKPANIMMREHGVCVLDFGVAKVLATSAEATMTQSTTGSGLIIGTPRYMSPEQCLGQRVGARSDLYSLGVLLYEMLAGRTPFIDPLPSAVLIKQATATPPPLQSFREDVPRALALAVHTLLAKRPEDRPKTAQLARVLLEKSLAQTPPRAAVTVPAAEPFASTVAVMGARRPVVLRAFAPVVVLALFGALLFNWERRPALEPIAAARTPYGARRFDIARRTNDSPNALDAASRDTGDAPDHAAPNAAAPNTNTTTLPDSSASALSLDDARRILGTHSQDKLAGVRVTQTPRGGTAIAAIHDEMRAGTSHLFVMEKRGAAAAYQIVSRAPLDATGFRGATWTPEMLDADGDGYAELLYAGENAANNSAQNKRLVLYVPRTRQAYALRLEEGAGESPSWRITLSPNALDTNARFYRAALLQKARAMIAAR